MICISPAPALPLTHTWSFTSFLKGKTEKCVTSSRAARKKNDVILFSQLWFGSSSSFWAHHLGRTLFSSDVTELLCDWSRMWSGRGYCRNAKIFSLLPPQRLNSNEYFWGMPSQELTHICTTHHIRQDTQITKKKHANNHNKTTTPVMIMMLLLQMLWTDEDCLWCVLQWEGPVKTFQEFQFHTWVSREVGNVLGGKKRHISLQLYMVSLFKDIVFIYPAIGLCCCIVIIAYLTVTVAGTKQEVFCYTSGKSSNLASWSSTVLHTAGSL